MKTEVRNEFILEAHKSACNEWKLKIEKECPELFVGKLEVGKWYKTENTMVFIDNIEREVYYGFYNGIWDNDWAFSKGSNMDICKPATEQEVKEALVKEAKKRGFKKGVIIDKLLSVNVGSLNIGNEKQLETNNFTISQSLQYLYSNNLVIFRKGKWAEIISNPIEEKINELQQQLDELKKQINYEGN